MIDSYDQYEEECQKIREDNAKLLDEFAEWLEHKGLSEKTVSKHRGNIDFFVNHYLLYEDARRPAEGVDAVDMFLGYWFIRKAMWASKASIKSNATSLKKFYTFMLDKGSIEEDDLEELKLLIKENMPDWLATVERFDDPEIGDPSEIWDL